MPLKIAHICHDPFFFLRFVSPIMKKAQDSGHGNILIVEKKTLFNRKIDQVDNNSYYQSVTLSLNPIIFISRILRLYLLLRKIQPDVVHTHTSKGSLIPLIAAFLAQIPHRIYQNHGLPYLGYNGVLKFGLLQLEKLNILFSTQIILVSFSNKKEAEKSRLFKKKQPIIIANGSAVGINLEEYASEYFLAEKNKFFVREQLGIPAESIVFGYVGRAIKRKGFQLLLESWKQANIDTPAHLIIAGCTPKDIHKIWKNPRPNTLALGFIKDMRQFYAACDVILLPSFHEGFPYALLEGAASCCALIGSDIPGIRDAIIDQKTGYLFKSGDHSDFIEKIKILLDREKLTLMGTKARERAVLEFDEKIVLDGYLQLYATFEKGRH